MPQGSALGPILFIILMTWMMELSFSRIRNWKEQLIHQRVMLPL